MQFHPAADIFPLLDGEAFAELVEDIRCHGLREPIVLHDGRVLDGRNRYRACREAGVEPVFENYEGDDVIAYVVSLNLKRRHLDESQRALVAARIATLPRGANQHTEISAPSQSEAAELLNVSVDSTQFARKVLDCAVPELVAAVEHGKASVSAAAEVATLPDTEQREIIASGEDEIIRAANRIKREKKERRRKERIEISTQKALSIAPSSERYVLKNEPCINALALDANSIDWVITDPPYPREFLPLYSELGEVAAHVLKPGGSLLCMVGQSYLPDVISLLCKHLEYQWTLAYLTPGGQAVQVFPRSVNAFWKPVLWFVKDGYSGNWVGDVSRSDANDNDKRFHHWGQSESGMADLMSRFVRPGDRVLDPFMGAGTTGVVALHLGCHFTGLDPDSDAFNQSLVRMGNADQIA